MATLKDVAREAGLTVSTVSRVLNNRGYISDDARKRVSEAMKKLNYRPNELARALQNKSSNTIGVLVPLIKNPYFSEMVNELEDVAFHKGYRVILCSSRGKEERKNEYLELCSANRVAGIILCTGAVSPRMFETMNIPMVALERATENCSASVECDNYTGGILAARALVEAGCRHLAYIGSVADLSMPADTRMDAFEYVCKEAGVSYVTVKTEVAMYESMRYESLIQEILTKNPEIDGIFAGSDMIALQTLSICRSLGKRIPEDVKLVGFDDILMADMAVPRLTTIHQPIRQMAETAIERLLDAAAGKEVPKQTVLPVELIRRDTL